MKKPTLKRGILTPLLITLLSLLGTAAPAQGAVKWNLTSSANTTAEPGEVFVYSVRLRNHGDISTPEGEKVIFDVEVPEGLEILEVQPSDLGGFWCPYGSVTPTYAFCENGPGSVLYPVEPTIANPQFASFIVYARVAPSASGVLSARFTIDGGNSSLSISDPTTITTEPPEFGADGFETRFTDLSGAPKLGAGRHPDEFAIDLGLNRTSKLVQGVMSALYPVGRSKGYLLELPPGFAFSLGVAQRCTTDQLAELDSDAFPPAPVPRCPVGSQIGTTSTLSSLIGDSGIAHDILSGPASLYNLVPPPGVFARFGSNAGGIIGVTDVLLRDGRPMLRFWNSSRAAAILSFAVQIWSDPSDPGHDLQRSCPGKHFPSIGGPRCVAASQAPAIIRNPTSCSAPGVGLESTVHLTSWEHPDVSIPASSTTHEPPGYPANPLDPATPLGPEVGTTGCADVPVKGEVSARPTTQEADSASGLDLEVSVPNAGISNQAGIATSDVKSLRVELPEGVTINPARAEGLSVCTHPQFAAEDLGSGSGCPAASKIGTVTIDTPMLEEDVPGSVYVAAPDDPATATAGAENPLDSRLALYIIIKSQERGLLLKLVSRVEADPGTGQLTATVGGLPQLPFSSVDLHLNSGLRSPLVTPQSCGEYTTRAELTPWSDPTQTLPSTSSFAITHGHKGRGCAAPGSSPFKFEAGTIHRRAGAFSPFTSWLDGADSGQEIAKASFDLPEGMAMSLSKLGRCSSRALEDAERNPGSKAADSICPATSQIGSAVASLGTGPVRVQAPGGVFLAGPYRGSPVSVAMVIRVEIGPLNLGTVVQRSALVVDPRTAAIEFDASDSSPIPTLLDGIALHLSSLRLRLDRDRLMSNPTSCSKMEVGARVAAAGLDPSSPANGSPSDLSAGFNAHGCSSLRFQPRLSLRLDPDSGPNPGLTATYRPRAADARVKRIEVRLPKALGLAEKGPSAIVGHIEAFTPLLDRPLRGAVRLPRPTGSPRPYLSAKLEGQVDVNLTARIRSGKDGLQATFKRLPDVPLTRLVLTIDGGALKTPANICRRNERAWSRLNGHNGSVAFLRPKIACPRA